MRYINGALALTLARGVCIPFIVAALMRHQWAISFLLVSFAALTDVLDGWYARRYQQTSVVGACLDTMIDKILVVSCYGTLMYISPTSLYIPVWFIIFVLMREIVVTVGSVYACFYVERLTISPTFLGKCNGVSHFFFMVALMIRMIYPPLPLALVYGTLYMVVVVVGISFIEYMYIFLRSVCLCK